MKAAVKWLVGAVALGWGAVLGAQETSERINGPNSVLVILAHPDDELTMAPALSRLARDGTTVTIVFATSGDVGPGTSGLEPGEELAQLREGEGRCSAKALGLKGPEFWRLGDGTLALKAREERSAARRALALTALAIAQTSPTVIMTWGPDGGYGHSDHRMISAIVTQVVQSMVRDRPELLYAAIPQNEVEGLPGFEQWARTPPELITDRLPYRSADLQAAAEATACYKSQFPVGARAMLAQVLHDQIWRGEIHFRKAFPAVE